MKTRRHMQRSKLRRKMRGGSARGRTSRGGSGGRVFIFYHIFSNEQTLNVVRDQIMKIIFSGLLIR